MTAPLIPGAPCPHCGSLLAEVSTAPCDECGGSAEGRQDLEDHHGPYIRCIAFGRFGLTLCEYHYADLASYHNESLGLPTDYLKPDLPTVVETLNSPQLTTALACTSCGARRAFLEMRLVLQAEARLRNA